MSLKQFPSASVQNGRTESSRPARVIATLFDAERAWDMIERKKEALQNQVDVGGLGDVGRNRAEQIANASGIKITKGFSIAKAIDSFRRIKFREMQAYGFFLLIFTVTTYYHRDFGQANQVRSSFETVLLKTKYLSSESGEYISFYDINTKSDFWDYLTVRLLPALFHSEPGCAKCASNLERLEVVMKYNKLIQPVRFRQLRVNSVDASLCDIAVDMIISGAEFKCWPSYSVDNENRSQIPGWQDGRPISYRSAESLATQPYRKATTTVYGGGGHVIDIPLGSTMETVLSLVKNLQRNGWIDLGTRAIFIDLCFYNPSAYFFTSVRILFEFMPFGDIRPTKSVGVMKGAALPNELEDNALYFMDIIIYVILLLFLLWDLKRIYSVGWLHFKSFWHWISFINYVVFSYTFVERQLYLSLPAIRAHSESLVSGGELNEVYDFCFVGLQYAFTSILTGWSAFLCWIRVLGYFRYFNRDLSILLSTVGNCAKDTLAWFLIMFVVVFAYAQAFFLAFGPEVDGFDTLGQSLGTLCKWTFYQVNVDDIIGIDQGLAGILFISFQAIYSLLLFDMILIVILRSYRDVKNAGVDDPIVVEIRKLVLSSFRIMKSKVRDIVVNFLPLRVAPDPNDFGSDDPIDPAEHEQQSTKRVRQMTREEYQHQLSLVMQRMESIAGEARYLTERLNEVTQTQLELNKVHAILEDAGHNDAGGADTMEKYQSGRGAETCQWPAADKTHNSWQHSALNTKALQDLSKRYHEVNVAWLRGTEVDCGFVGTQMAAR